MSDRCGAIDCDHPPIRNQPCCYFHTVETQEGVKPWFAPLCRQGPHPLIGHHAAMRRLCDCPCHETDGPWWSER